MTRRPPAVMAGPVPAIHEHSDDSSGWREMTIEAVASARYLMDRGHPNGAVNRAYFAMLYVVFMALRRRGFEVRTPKQRAMIHRSFRDQLRKMASKDADLAEAFDRAERFRWVADYGFSDVSTADAAGIVASLDEFVARTDSALPHMQSEAIAS